ncbi:MAG: putative membrane protein [Lysobacterales bacterium]|jgi:putative membrane protein
MNDETIIRQAEFDPKVRTYWLLSGALLCVVTLVGIPLLLIWIPIGRMLTGHYLERMDCVLTEKALKVKKGIMVRVEKTIPLDKITDMAVVQGPIMRHFDICKLTVETAGQSGPGALVALIGIVDAKSFREDVLAQRDIVSNQSKLPTVNIEQSSAAPVGDTLEEVRDSLLRIEKLLSTRVPAERDSGS